MRETCDRRRPSPATAGGPPAGGRRRRPRSWAMAQDLVDLVAAQVLGRTVHDSAQDLRAEGSELRQLGPRPGGSTPPPGQ